MEPDVIRLYSSSPPPMEDAEEEEDEDEFGDFSSVSAGEPDAPGLATPPLELFNGVPVARRDVKANGVAPGSHLAPVGSRDRSDVKRPDCHVAGGDGEIITNGFASSDVESGPQTFVSCHDNAEGDAGNSEAEFADFAAFSHSGHHRGGCAARRTAAQPDGEQSDCAAGGERGGGGVRCQGSNGICLDVDHVGVEWITVDDTSVDANSVDHNSADHNSVDGTSVSDAGPDGVRVDGGPEGNAGVDAARVSADGRTSDLEEYGGLSATGSPPLLREESATLADRSQLDEDDEEFGDFGDAGPFGEQAFAGSNCREACSPQACDDFADFKAPKADADEEGGASFGHFAAAHARWSAFGEETEGALASAEASWAPFGSDDDASEAQTAAVEQDGSGRWETPWTRVEKLLEASFPRAADAAASPEERVASLKTLLEAAGSALGGGVWPRLRDVHQAVGLRHQWGGSYCNKTLLACLGIDTRNILFTGQKKQPLIVPVYAASLGMLEPTKESAKPVSAAEMIASIAQAATAAQGPSDAVQEALPPVQFDWSSSGLTNPLDASGGSFLLNLDFFGSVDDSGSSCSADIPGVDPELVELTTAKMDSGGAGSRVADAFARLMSTVDKTSTSTRRTRKDEKLSSEAAEVICGLPDLSFMTAKVLMFPATLVPLSASATPD